MKRIVYWGEDGCRQSQACGFSVTKKRAALLADLPVIKCGCPCYDKGKDKQSCREFLKAVKGENPA